MSSTVNEWAVGHVVPGRELESYTGERLPLPAPDKLVHLQLRRFAGCPVCNLHLRSFVARNTEIDAAGVREIVVFHSDAKALAKYEADLPFAVVADPDKRLYREFGVEPSLKALLNPAVWLTVAKAMSGSIRATLRGRAPLAPLAPQGGNFGLPADLLIGPDGRIVAVKYGRHAYDQWSVEEVLDLAATVTAGRS